MGMTPLAPLVLICALAVWIWNGSQRGDDQ